MRPVLIATMTLLLPGLAAAQPPAATVAPLVRAVDLNVGDSAVVKLADGKSVQVKLLDLQEVRDPIRKAVRLATVKVEVDGRVLALESANYRLPQKVGTVQIDCPITRGYNVSHHIPNKRDGIWGLVKDARLRLWPAASPLIQPGTFAYPVKQRWFASMTQMANEPVYVDGGENPANLKIYYHYGLDIGGSEEQVEVVAATDGLVVSSGTRSLPGFADTPVAPRYDVIYILDERGWYYRYSHLFTIDVKVGDRVKLGQKLGLLGKEGGSGGWSHLHFDITSRQPSGLWGIQDGYAYLWEAYQQKYKPALLAVARPHHFIRTGDSVALDGSRSWARVGIAKYEWLLTDGTSAGGALLKHKYDKAGAYSEILKVTDQQGRVDYDFAIVQVLDKDDPKQLPPTIHAVYFPTQGIKPRDALTFKVRTFRTTDGDEVWNFGDGSPLVKVKSDGNVKPLARDGYAVTTHRFARPGQYLVSVQRTNAAGLTATARLHVHVTGPVRLRYLRPAGDKFALESEVAEQRRTDGWRFQSITHRPAETMKLVLTFDSDQRLLTAKLEHTTREVTKSAAARFADKTVNITRPGQPPEQLVFDQQPVLATTAPDWSDILLLVKRYRPADGGKQTCAGLWFHPTVPTRKILFTIDRTGTDTITVQGRKQELQRFLVTLRSGAYLVWADAAGRVIKLMPPNRPQGAVVLEGFERATGELK
jgi:hypothetical protein